MTAPTLRTDLDFDAPRRLVAAGIADHLIAGAYLQDELGFDLAHLLWAFARHTETRQEVEGVQQLADAWCRREGLRQGTQVSRLYIEQGLAMPWTVIREEPQGAMLSVGGVSFCETESEAVRELKRHVLALFPEVGLETARYTVSVRDLYVLAKWQHNERLARRGFNMSKPIQSYNDQRERILHVWQVLAAPDFLPTEYGPSPIAEVYPLWRRMQDAAEYINVRAIRQYDDEFIARFYPPALNTPRSP